MPDCKTCKDRQARDIPYIAYEAECARHDRNIKRLAVVIVICIALLVVSNLAWLYAWNQFDYVDESYDYTQDGRGINIIGNDNEAGQYGTEIDNTPQD